MAKTLLGHVIYNGVPSLLMSDGLCDACTKQPNNPRVSMRNLVYLVAECPGYEASRYVINTLMFIVFTGMITILGYVFAKSPRAMVTRLLGDC